MADYHCGKRSDSLRSSHDLPGLLAANATTAAKAYVQPGKVAVFIVFIYVTFIPTLLILAGSAAERVRKWMTFRKTLLICRKQVLSISAHSMPSLPCSDQGNDSRFPNNPFQGRSS